MKDCPVPECDTRIDETLLVCTTHWRMIPPRLRARVKSMFAKGRGLETDAYLDAVDDAVASVAGRRSAVAA